MARANVCEATAFHVLIRWGSRDFIDEGLERLDKTKVEARVVSFRRHVQIGVGVHTLLSAGLIYSILFLCDMVDSNLLGTIPKNFTFAKWDDDILISN